MDGRINSPHSAGLPDPKMELLEVTNRVLLVLPVGPILLGAESTPKPVPHLLQESVTCPREAKPMIVVHSVDFLSRQGASECIWGHSIHESLGNPADGKVLSSPLSGYLLQSRDILLAIDCRLFSRFVIDAMKCPAALLARGFLSDQTHGCIMRRLFPIHIEMTSRRGAELSPSGVLPLVRELGDACCTRAVDETRMSRWIILLGLLAECQKISKSNPRPNEVKLESVRPAPGNVPLLFPLIGTIVAIYSIDAPPIDLTYICIVSRCHLPCRRRIVMSARFGVTKRQSRICRGVERGIGCSLGSGVILIHVGWVGGLILKGICQS